VVVRSLSNKLDDIMKGRNAAAERSGGNVSRMTEEKQLAVQQEHKQNDLSPAVNNSICSCSSVLRTCCKHLPTAITVKTAMVSDIAALHNTRDYSLISLSYS